MLGSLGLGVRGLGLELGVRGYYVSFCTVSARTALLRKTRENRFH